MSTFKAKFNRFIKNLRSRYRLVILNEKTFEERIAITLTKLNVFILGSVFAVSTIAITTALIAFTSLREYIPGYGDLNLRRNVVNQKRIIDDLDYKFKLQAAYITSIKEVLKNNIKVEKITSFDKAISQTDIQKDLLIEEDAVLRKQVAEEKQAQAYNIKPTNSKQNNKNKSETLFFIKPIEGLVTTDFNISKKQYGVDLSANAGTPVKSVLNGIVVIANWNYETGNTIVIQHQQNLISVYKNNAKILKTVGDKVSTGEAIAIANSKLKFEIWQNGVAQNPTKIIDLK